MLHPLALHVPWLKRDKLVFVSFLHEEQKLEWDLKPGVKQVLLRKALEVRKPSWTAEATTEGTEAKWLWLQPPFRRQPWRHLPGCAFWFSYKKGWGEALCTDFYQTSLQCVLWAWKLRHPCLHALKLPNILPCTLVWKAPHTGSFS